jgi:hypothetical protein
MRVTCMRSIVSTSTSLPRPYSRVPNDICTFRLVRPLDTDNDSTLSRGRHADAQVNIPKQTCQQKEEALPRLGASLFFAVHGAKLGIE